MSDEISEADYLGAMFDEPEFDDELIEEDKESIEQFDYDYDFPCGY